VAGRAGHVAPGRAAGTGNPPAHCSPDRRAADARPRRRMRPGDPGPGAGAGRASGDRGGFLGHAPRRSGDGPGRRDRLSPGAGAAGSRRGRAAGRPDPFAGVRRGPVPRRPDVLRRSGAAADGLGRGGCARRVRVAAGAQRRCPGDAPGPARPLGDRAARLRRHVLWQPHRGNRPGRPAGRADQLARRARTVGRCLVRRAGVHRYRRLRRSAPGRGGAQGAARLRGASRVDRSLSRSRRACACHRPAGGQPGEERRVTSPTRYL
jgi:hypothetical protein